MVTIPIVASCAAVVCKNDLACIPYDLYRATDFVLRQRNCLSGTVPGYLNLRDFLATLLSNFLWLVIHEWLSIIYINGEA